MSAFGWLAQPAVPVLRDEQPDDAGVELGAGIHHQLVEGCLCRARRLVATVRSHGVEGVDYQEDPGQERYFGPGQSAGVAEAVEAFVMGEDSLGDAWVNLVVEKGPSEAGVMLHLAALDVVEGAGFSENPGFDANLADVMEHAGYRQMREAGVIDSEMAAELHRQVGDPEAVGDEVIAAGPHGVNKLVNHLARQEKSTRGRRGVTRVLRLIVGCRPPRVLGACVC